MRERDPCAQTHSTYSCAVELDGAVEGDGGSRESKGGSKPFHRENEGRSTGAADT